MATLTVDRPYALKDQGNNGPYTLLCPVSAQAANFFAAGDFVEFASGLVNALTPTANALAAATAQVLGIIEKSNSAATTAGDLFPVTLVLPNFLYDLSQVKGGASAQADAGTSVTIAEDSTFPTATGTGVAEIFTPLILGSQGFSYVVNAFRASIGGALTAGQSMSGGSGRGTVVTDSNLRVLGMFGEAVIQAHGQA